MNFIALDTETTLIKDRPCLLRDKGSFEAGSSLSRKGAIYTGPFETPRLLFGSRQDKYYSCVEKASDFILSVRTFLGEKDTHLVFHNAAFDIPVLCAADPELWPLFWTAMEQGRVHDSMILDVLYRLSNGHYDRLAAPDYKAVPQIRNRSLEELAREYAGMELTKDPAIRLGFEQFEGRALPPEFRAYALQDAEATYKVWENLLSRSTTEKLWSEPLQTRAAVALSFLERRGVHINRAEATRLRGLFERDIPGLEKELVVAGLGKWKPKPKSTIKTKFQCGLGLDFVGTPGVWMPSAGPDGLVIGRVKVFKKHHTLEVARPAFCLDTKALRRRLTELGRAEGVALEYTPTGLLKIDAEAWAYYISPDDAGLTAWTKYEKLTKIVGTYLKLYSSADQVFPRWNVMGARSGRMSASCPNVQNVSKRKYGIRSLFVPAPNKVFIRADYKTQELLTLAEAMLGMGISGPLLDTLKSGRDIHTQTASLLTGVEYSAVTKQQRQAAKACAFGVPGGLGPRKLADYAKKEYGVNWTLAESKEKRAAFLTGYPDIATYLAKLNTDFNSNLMRISGRGISYWRETLGVDRPGVRAVREAMTKHSSLEIRRLVWEAERSLSVTLPSGRVRKGCLYTEAANTHFQGSAADVTKQAVFLATRYGLNVVMVVHDEIVVESTPEDYRFDANFLRACMQRAFVELCPNVGPYAAVEIEAPLKCWGAATAADGSEI